MGWRHLEVLQGAGGHLLPAGTDGDRAQVGRLRHRGWDGVDPGRTFHFLPPNGDNSIEGYEGAGWAASDAEAYTNAYFENFGQSCSSRTFASPERSSTGRRWMSASSEAITGQSTQEDALNSVVADFEAITDRLGREAQLEQYKASLGL